MKSQGNTEHKDVFKRIYEDDCGFGGKGEIYLSENEEICSVR